MSHRIGCAHAKKITQQSAEKHTAEHTHRSLATVPDGDSTPLVVVNGAFGHRWVTISLHTHSINFAVGQLALQPDAEAMRVHVQAEIICF